MKRRIFTSFVCVMSWVLSMNAQEMIYGFTFDETDNATVGSGSFGGGGQLNYTAYYNGAYYLNSMNGASASLSGLPTGSEPRSIAFWFNRQGGGSVGLVSYGNTTNRFGLGFTASGDLEFQYDGQSVALGIAGLAGNTWHHIAIVYDGTTMQLYRAGELVSSLNVTCATQEGLFQLGTMIGYIDELQIYDYAISAEDVLEIKDTGYITPEPAMIASYSFDNTMEDQNGDGAFASNAGTSFVSDRYDNPTGALRLQDLGTEATIYNLPYGAKPRSIALWVKFSEIQNESNFIYSYGNNDYTNAEGAYITPSEIVHFFPTYDGASAIEVDTWNHLVFTYNGITRKIYLNGAEIAYTNEILYTSNGDNTFTLGLTEDGAANYFDGAIDDLRIYNYNLSSAEITSLYLNEPIVFIPDPNFKSELVSNLDINLNGDGEIQQSEAESYEGYIWVGESGISSLEGLEAFTAISGLGCAYNSLTSIDVSANTELVALYCGYNQITSLDLSNNPNLTELVCDNNALTFLKLANGNNDNLEYLICYDNPDLACIQVDDAAYAQSNWINGEPDSKSPFQYDEGVEFSENCLGGVSVGELNSREMEWVVFPNPVSSSLHVISDSKEVIQIIDPVGHVVMQVVLNEGVNTIDLNNWASGIYMIHSASGNVKRFVKE